MAEMPKVFAEIKISSFCRESFCLPDLRKLPGELPGKSGKLLGNLSIAVKSHSERTSGEVAGELPVKSGELPGTFQKLGGARVPPIGFF